MKEGKHIIFLDYVRIVACLMVMLVHSSENFYGGLSTMVESAAPLYHSSS